jgi:hypothetical protein
MPFRSAAKLVGDLLHVQISEPTVRRYTEAGGAAYVDIQTEKVEWIENTHPAEPETAERLVLVWMGRWCRCVTANGAKRARW